MSSDLLLRPLPANRPAIGEVKVSSTSGHDADPVYALVQALALASQLAGAKQRARLHTSYPEGGFAGEGPIDVLVMLFLIGGRGGTDTNREELIECGRQLCGALDQGALLPHVQRVGLIEVRPQEGQLDFRPVAAP